MAHARAHVVGAILQAGAVFEEPAFKEASFLLVLNDRTGDLHSPLRGVPRVDDPVDLIVRGVLGALLHRHGGVGVRHGEGGGAAAGGPIRRDGVDDKAVVCRLALVQRQGHAGAGGQLHGAFLRRVAYLQPAVHGHGAPLKGEGAQLLGGAPMAIEGHVPVEVAHMVHARAHVVGAILQAGAVLKEPALKEAFFLLAAEDRTGDLHSSIHRFVPRMDDPVDLKVRGGLLRPGNSRLLALVHFAFHQNKAVVPGQILQFEGIIILVRRIRFCRDDGACAGSLQLVCHDGRAVGFHVQRAVCHNEVAAPNAILEEVALRVRACNGHSAVLDGDVLVRAACPDRVITNVVIDIACNGKVCIVQRQRASRHDSDGIGKGGGAGNGQLFRQFGLDAAVNALLCIPAQREIGIVQGQGVGIRVKLHGAAVAQHVVLVGLRDLRTCHPKVVGIAFLLVRVHIC